LENNIISVQVAKVYLAYGTLGVKLGPGGFKLPLSCLYLRNEQPPHMGGNSINYEEKEDGA
jgi:hypothetical protein